MRYPAIISYLILSLVAIVAGGAMGYYFFYNQHLFILFILGFFISIMGCMAAAIFISLALLPSETHAYFSKGFGKESFVGLRKGKPKLSRRFNKLFLISITILAAAAFVPLFYKIDQFHKYQITHFGKRIKVEIIDSQYSRGRSVQFQFMFNGNLYSHWLSSTTLNKGDSVYIVYSTQIPIIVQFDENQGE
jgi:hypothetical protein